MNRSGFVAAGAISLTLVALMLLYVSFFSPTSTSASAGSGVLYGTDAGVAGLYSINTSTGVGAFIGNINSGTAPALTTDPFTGNLYAGTGGIDNDLYLVNVGNPAISTLVGGGGLGGAGYGSMDFDSAGVLYASANISAGAGSGSDHLVTINKTTGMATIVGPFGVCAGVTIPAPPAGGDGSCTIEGMEGIAFDSAGTLWGVLNERGGAGTPGLYTINKATGAAAFVTAIDDAAAGLHPSAGVVTIQFDCDGTLYAGSARRQGAANVDGGKLGRINTTTGEFTFISPTPITTGNPANSLGGLAFSSNCLFDVEKVFAPSNPGSVNVSLSCTNGGVATTLDGTASQADDANFKVNGYTLGSDPICTATETGVPAGYTVNNCQAVLSAGGCTIVNPAITPTPGPVGGLVDLPVTPTGAGSNGAGTALLAILLTSAAVAASGGAALSLARRRS